MIKEFEKLSEANRISLLKAPVLISLLAASEDNEISQDAKAEAIRLAHLKTFTADSLLLPYYGEVDKFFSKYFVATAHKYAPFDDASREALKKEINGVNIVIAGLDKYFARALHTSLSGYAAHVKKASRSILLDFIFPVPIPGFTD